MRLIFDSHAHYDDEAFNEDRIDILKNLPEKGIFCVVNVGTCIETSKKAIEIASTYDYIWASIGIHPTYTNELKTEFIDKLKELAKDEKVVAIGEIGLDYHYGKETVNEQKEMFEKQLELAIELDKPVIIHNREAHLDTMALLKKYKPKGVVHCFSGSLEMANELIKQGMYIGLGGAVTFKNAKNPVNVAQNIPLEYMVLETDAPYMTPVPFRGKRCDSSHIQFTAQKIAELRGMDVEKLLEITKNNAIKLFRLEGKM